MATWATIKEQAATLLGLQLVGHGRHSTSRCSPPTPTASSSPARARPAAVRDRRPAWSRATPPPRWPVPANVAALRHAVPDRHRAQRGPVAEDSDHNPATPPVAPAPDADTSPRPTSPASRPAPTTTRCSTRTSSPVTAACNENIGLTAIHQVFHSEHDRLVGDIKNVAHQRHLGQRRRCPGRVEAGRRVPTAGTASACSRPPGSSPRWSTSTWCSRSSPARSSRRSTRSSRSRSPRPTSTRRSRPSSPTPSTASATRC